MYKKVIQKYRERVILKRIFLSTFGISALFITIACFIGFAWFQKAKVEELVKNDQETLSSYYAVIENNINSAQRTLETLSKNVYVKRIILKSNIDWNDNMSVVANSILSTISVNPNLHSIYIFSEKGILLKSSNYQYPTTIRVDLKAEDTFRNSYLKRMNPWVYTDVYKKERQILSLTLGNVSKNGSTFENGVEINLDMGDITKDLFPETVKDENYVILTTEGNVLAEGGEDFHFGENVSDNTFIKSVLSANEKTDTIRLKKDKVKYLVSFIHSSDNYYYMIHIYPYGNLMRSIAYSRNMVILCGILLTLVSLLISLWMALRVYHPIDEVVEYVNRPEKTDVEIKNKLLKNNELTVVSEKLKVMARQLNHFHEEKEAEDMIHYLSNSHNTHKVPLIFSNYFKEAFNKNISYFCVVIRICDIENVMEEGEDHYLKQMNQILEITNSSFDFCKNCLTYVLDSEYIVTIIIDDVREINDSDIVEKAEEIISHIKNSDLLPINIGISRRYEKASMLYQVYQTAKAVIKYRFLFGENSIITEEQVEKCSFGGSDQDFELKGLIASVRKLDKKTFAVEFKRLEAFIMRHSLQTGYDLLISLACEMFLYHNEITQYRSSLGFLDYENAQKEVLSFQYISDAFPWFYTLLEKIEETIGESLKKGTSEIVDKAVKYIMENYNDVNISAQQLADYLNITPSYFSRIFNDYTNCAFPDYLTNLRLEQAKRKLIEEPSKCIQKICEEVGYLNSSYFTAQFKKKYGIPPSKYRLNNHIK